MQNKNTKKRNDDEFYTPRKFVEKHLIDYKDIFDKYDRIWLPFSKKSHPMYQVFYEKYGDRVVCTPDFCYDKKSGVNDFFKVFEPQNLQWLSELLTYKVLVFDNPPFSEFMKIAKILNEFKIDWMLYGGTLCGANKIKFGGWDILGRVMFENRTNWVNVSLFSPLFTQIKYVFGYSPTDRLLEIGDKPLESYNGHLSSSEIVNVCQRGYVLNISDYRYEKGKDEHKFGGSILLK